MVAVFLQNLGGIRRGGPRGRSVFATLTRYNRVGRCRASKVPFTSDFACTKQIKQKRSEWGSLCPPRQGEYISYDDKMFNIHERPGCPKKYPKARPRGVYKGETGDTKNITKSSLTGLPQSVDFRVLWGGGGAHVSGRIRRGLRYALYKRTASISSLSREVQQGRPGEAKPRHVWASNGSWEKQKTNRNTKPEGQPSAPK